MWTVSKMRWCLPPTYRGDEGDANTSRSVAEGKHRKYSSLSLSILRITNRNPPRRERHTPTERSTGMRSSLGSAVQLWNLPRPAQNSDHLMLKLWVSHTRLSTLCALPPRHALPAPRMTIADRRETVDTRLDEPSHWTLSLLYLNIPKTNSNKSLDTIWNQTLEPHSFE